MASAVGASVGASVGTRCRAAHESGAGYSDQRMIRKHGSLSRSLSQRDAGISNRTVGAAVVGAIVSGISENHSIETPCTDGRWMAGI
jgi:hypothetical protein